jgi:biotin carboxyl carrier protein
MTRTDRRLVVVERRGGGADETRWTVTVAERTARIDGGPPLDVAPAGPGTLRVGSAEAAATAYVAASGATRWVFLAGVAYEFEVDAAGAAPRRRAAAVHGPLAAPMPATVIRIVAPPGTRVARGDVVLLLEAMKMELPLRAPHEATVAAVHCREGDLVVPGQPLVELE